MAKVQIKSEKLTPFGGIFSIMEQFDALLARTIDSTLGLRCTLYGYQYSAKLCHLGSDGRLQEVDSIVADSHEEIKHCQTEQEDHNTKINRTHIFY